MAQRRRPGAAVVGRLTEAVTPKTKRDNGVAFPAAAYAYVGDPNKPSTWKVRLWESLEHKETAAQVGRAVTALRAKEAVPADATSAVRRRIAAAWRKTHPKAKATEVPASLKESMAGGRTFNEISELVETAIEDKLGINDEEELGGGVWVRDLTDAWAVYCINYGDDLHKVEYSIDDAGVVTLGEPTDVEAQTAYVTATESRDRVEGRIIEAKGVDDATGGKVFGVQIVAYGDSKNRRRYTESVLSAGAHLYEGAKAYDHHRTDMELATSTIAGLVGSYRNVTAGPTGLEAELHLLPSATHTAEALEASLAAEADGRPPLVGVSHDVKAMYVPAVGAGGTRLQEATEIVQVFSADVVADPAAGGRATRMVAGGTGDLELPEGEPMTLKELIAALREATTAEAREALLTEHASVLEDAGLVVDDVVAPLESADAGAGGTGGEGAAGSGTGTAAAGEPKEPAAAGAGRGTEARAREAVQPKHAKASVMGRILIREAVTAAKLDDHFLEAVTDQLGDEFTEADLDRQIGVVSTLRQNFEKAGLAPSVTATQVTKESHDKRVEALDAMFDSDFSKGYRSFKEAYLEFHPEDRRLRIGDEDLNRKILRESLGVRATASGMFLVPTYDSSMRMSESVDTTTWDQVLGDSITRRLMKVYAQPNLQTWRKVVSGTPPINDFRTQRIDRLGGYGVLPTVAEGAPYQPLVSPTDEEATYALLKRGGLEDLTLEAIANDDLRAVQRIPNNLGLAAALTLYRFVFDMIATNVTCTYDSTALFAAGHNNTDAASALAQSTLSAGRKKMRKQAAYGNAADVLSIVPRLLIVPSDLEEIAFQLVTSAVAIGANAGSATGANASDIPNIHQGLEPVVVDYWSDTNDWFIEADPAMVDTIEVGFYQGRQDPELFVQNDPAVGSVFNADKVTWKIRHIYSGTVLDHRGFYRGQG